MFACLLVLVWPAISSHALLEHLDVIHVAHSHHGEDASHEHHQDNHGFADGICALASSQKLSAKSDAVGNLTPGQDAVLEVIPSAFDRPMLGRAGLPPPRSAPSGLNPTWQFRLRLALPARAPSLLS